MHLCCDQSVSLAEQLGVPELILAARRLILKASAGRPVIAVLGAHGRGKTTLCQRITGLPLEPDSTVRVYGPDATAGQRFIAELPPEYGLHMDGWQALPDPPAGAFWVDTPALDTQTGRPIAEMWSGLCDVALLCVQSNQPTGEAEAAFAKEYLADLPTLLVLTKADLLDSEDFATAWEEAQRLYAGAIGSSLLGIVMSGWDPLPETSLPTLPAWLAQHPAIIHQARVARQFQAWARWRSEFRQALRAAEEENDRTHLEKRQQQRQESRQRQSQRQLLMAVENAIAEVGQAAEREFRQRIAHLEVDYAHTLDAALQNVWKPADVETVDLALRRFLEEWEEEMRRRVRQAAQPIADRLRQLLFQMTLMEQSISRGKSTALSVRSRQEGNLLPSSQPPLFRKDNFELSMPARIRKHVLPVVDSLVSGLIAAHWFGPLGWILIPLRLIGYGGGTREDQRKNLQMEIRQTAMRELPRLRLQLQEQFQQQWQAFQEDLRAQVKPRLEALAAALHEEESYRVNEADEADLAYRRRERELADLRARFAAWEMQMMSWEGHPDALG